MNDGSQLIVDRKTSGSVFVERASVSLLGTIQPPTSQRVFGEAERVAGLLARLLLAYPPERPALRTDEALPDEVAAEWRVLLSGLLALPGATDELFPHALGLFETTEHSRAIADHALGPDEDRLRAAWQAEVTETLTAAGLNLPANARPILGGRRGQNVPALAELLDAIQEVYKLDPTAKW